jgi:hypothetical protein
MSFGFWVQCSGFGVQGFARSTRFGFRVQGSGFRVQGFGFGALGFGSEEAANPSMVKRAASFLGLAKQAPTVSKVSTLHMVEYESFDYEVLRDRGFLLRVVT